MKRKTLFILITALFFMSLGGIAHAEFKYTLLESFPGFFTAGTTGPELPAMILAIYKFGIWTVGIAGLFMLTIGGFMYMASAGNNATVTSAKKIIADSLLGIVAALGAYLIMYVINPDLTNINIAFTQAQLGAGTGAAPATTPPVTPGGALPAGGTYTSLSDIPTQVSSQDGDASTELANLVVCIANKLPNQVQISSISDSNGGVNCYTDHPAWGQCTGNTSTNCCFHAKNSCHYGGPSCPGKSYAADFSSTGSSASIDQILSVASTCGANYTLDESNHAHVSVGASCGCN